MIAFDVDGVLTDGKIIYGPEGEQLKVFHAHDGLGLKLLQQAGFIVAVISGRESNPLRKRLQDLGIDHAFLGCSDKVKALSDLASSLGLHLKDCGFMGDDLIDYAVMRQVGYRLCPKNAVADIQAISDYVTTLCGGAGAVREAAEHLLQLKGVSPLSLMDSTEKKQ